MMGNTRNANKEILHYLQIGYNKAIFFLKRNSKITMGNRNGIPHSGVRVGRARKRGRLAPFGTQSHAQPGPNSQRPLVEGFPITSPFF